MGWDENNNNPNVGKDEKIRGRAMEKSRMRWSKGKVKVEKVDYVDRARLFICTFYHFLGDEVLVPGFEVRCVNAK